MAISLGPLVYTLKVPFPTKIIMARDKGTRSMGLLV